MDRSQQPNQALVAVAARAARVRAARVMGARGAPAAEQGSRPALQGAGHAPPGLPANPADPCGSPDLVQPPLDRLHQHRLVEDRLGQVVVEAGREELLPIPGHRVCGEGDDG